ncbi:MAG TPA: hypothetical protein VGU02_03655, partial [Gaiellaceae bacterium]|nr:hypothetical protein [Gaiellaceae bacterium]
MAALAVDGRGRIWVASSGASSHQDDAVYMIERSGALPQRVITRVRGPLGLQWLNQSLYVSSLDGVIRFSELDPQGHFIKRQLILRGPVRGAENNNLLRTPGGRLVMAVSAVCDHCATTPRYSGAIVSFRPGGSDLRIVAGGIRAPFGLVYDHSQLYATMNQRDDLGAKTPGDWLAAIEPGQRWGFPFCYGQTGGACRRAPKAVAVLDPHGAAGGVAVLGQVAIV